MRVQSVAVDLAAVAGAWGVPLHALALRSDSREVRMDSGLYDDGRDELTERASTLCADCRKLSHVPAGDHGRRCDSCGKVIAAESIRRAIDAGAFDAR